MRVRAEAGLPLSALTPRHAFLRRQVRHHDGVFPGALVRREGRRERLDVVRARREELPSVADRPGEVGDAVVERRLVGASAGLITFQISYSALRQH